uniref:Phosphatidic acid phosphatase type 2D n=1 Tax=Haplochromis burtoni TaxID=8153 RepID=A0A3Q3BMB3_HAPBU
MQKLNSTGTHSSMLPQDEELQRRLADSGGSGEGKENGAGKQFLTQPEVESSFCTKRKMLVCLDVLCLCIASIPFFACEMKFVTPYKRGFFCGDPSITYPNITTEAIPDSLLIAGGIAITGVAIAVGECYRVRFRGVHSRAFVRNCYVSCLYKELGSFLFGCCIGQSLTNMAKLSVGRLRPNFLDVCNITYASINCKEGIYVPAESIVCSAEKKLEEEARCVVYVQLSAFSGCCIQKPKLMCNIWLRLWIFSFRKSFFSGHASFAMYTMLYLAFYLQARLSWRGARLLRPLIQFFLVMIAVYTGLSRISDYRHHPTDVLTGFIQGGLTAYWVAFYISTMFKPCARPDGSPTSMSLESPLSSQQTVC